MRRRDKKQNVIFEILNILYELRLQAADRDNENAIIAKIREVSDSGEYHHK